MKTDTMIVPCKAYDLLSKADVIIVNDYHLKSWILDPIDDCEDDDVVLSFDYAGDDGYDYWFKFTRKALLDAKVEDGNIMVEDNSSKEYATIVCHKLERLT